MGGLGSGRHYWSGSRTTVESCRPLDANRWMREGILVQRIKSKGSWVWLDSITGENKSSIGYEVDTTHINIPWVRLYYTITGSREQVDYKVRLQTTHPNYGGVRWWFTCPLTANGKSCQRRVGKLYIPPNGSYYGCRQCYDLTYQSCNESHKFDQMFALIAERLP